MTQTRAACLVLSLFATTACTKKEIRLGEAPTLVNGTKGNDAGGRSDSPVAGPDSDVSVVPSSDGPQFSNRPDAPTIDTPPPFTSPWVKSFPEKATCTGPTGAMAEALQKALWFLHAQKSGPGVLDSQYVEWRGDAHVTDAHIKLDPTDDNGVNLSQTFINQYRSILDPKGTGDIDLAGGFYDAGDYIKFGITTGFAAHTLGWALYAFPRSFQDTGLEGEALNLLKWVDDYFIKSTFLDNDGKVIAFAHQVGDTSDHTCGWMPPELRRTDFCPRKGYLATNDDPAADVTASASAALALTSIVMKAKDPAYASKALKYATALYEFAAKHPNSVAATSGGFYNSDLAFDDLAWAAVWMYKATGGTQSYLNDILGPPAPDGTSGGGGWLDSLPGFRTDCLKTVVPVCWNEFSTHIWNSVRTGVFLELAQILRDTKHPFAESMRSIARADSMKWPQRKVVMSPGGFSVFADYGSARYNSAAQFVALLYAKYFGTTDAEAVSAITPWAKQQMDYILGNNPLSKSYVMGYSSRYANQPHHAASHASIWGLPGSPVENRHILWGALVNGPDLTDQHIDDRADFSRNEVSLDYNTSLIAALAAQYDLRDSGHCPLAQFPPAEPKTDEFYTLSNLASAQAACRSTVAVTLMNETVHPPRYDAHLAVKYFFDIGELLAKGGSLGDITASLAFDAGASQFGEPTQISQPKLCPKSATTAYVELSFEGYLFWGRIAKLKAPRSFVLDIGTTQGSGCTWDPANDWSYAGLKTVATSTDDGPKTPHVPVYSGNILVWGEEPPCW